MAIQNGNRPCVMGVTHTVAAGHYMSAQAGLQMLEAGGNAIDSGVAAGIATGVLEGIHVSVGGVAPILIWLAERGEAVTISGVGCWPKKATAEYFQKRHGGKIPVGVERTVVPAAPDAWITALAKYGTMSFAEVAAPAIRIAREGFPVYPHMANFIRDNEQAIRRFPSTEEIYLPHGRPPELGEKFVQSDLAATLQFLADEERAAACGGRVAGLQAARDAFYRGDIARRILAFNRAEGGLLDEDDLASFRVGIEPPVRGQFGDVSVMTCGPWCQGPMLLQELALLDPAALARYGHNTPEYIHEIVEAIKLAAADREAYYGDPRFVEVPMAALLDDGYSRERRTMIDPRRAAAGMPKPGLVSGAAWPKPWNLPSALAGEQLSVMEDESVLDTSYLCAVDRWGNAFSATPSDGNATAPIVPGLGFVPSPRGSQSRPEPDHACSVGPGKRPRLTPNPALAVKNGEWVMPFGTPGGDVQTQAMLQCLINFAVFGMNPQHAVEAPRFATFSFPSSFAPFEYRPNLLQLEGRIERETGDALAERGHDVKWWADRAWPAGSVCMIHHDIASGVKSAGADFRRTAYAVAW
jgi:gamma-glutamyltranspeptidase / glutathione hydrolase